MAPLDAPHANSNACNDLDRIADGGDDHRDLRDH